MRLSALFMPRHAALLLKASASALLFFSVAARAQSQDAPKYEVGAEFSSLSLRSPDFAGTQDVVGGGVRFTYNVSDSLALEAAAYSYQRLRFSDGAVGGNPAQMQFGVKAGRRFRSFGLFAKARPGVVFLSGVRVTGTQVLNFEGQQFVVPTFEGRRRSNFSTDVGGVLEFYPSRRLVTRFDFGDTMIRYGSRRSLIFTDPATNITLPAETRHNFQFTAGVGFRF
jgi:Outer membrane protein beta-barrel domain